MSAEENKRLAVQGGTASCERGLFITFEGGDGAGKTTQLRLLAEALEKRGLEVLCLHEPGHTALGERVRNLLLDKYIGKVDYMAELLLFEAARAQLVTEVVMPALERGVVVLCDRFTDSTLAYQGYGRGLDIDVISQLNELASRGLAPDRTLLLTVDSDAALARAMGSSVDGEGDRMENEGNAFHRAVDTGFSVLPEMFPERIRIVDGVGDPSEVHQRVLSQIEDLLQVSEGER